MFCVTDLLEFLEDHVRQLYDIRLNDRVVENEFEDDDSEAHRPDDMTFYTKVFLPIALLYTYQEIHPDCEIKELLSDLFNLGAGSKTVNLSPETNAICHEWCASVYFPHLKSKEDKFITEINLKVFQEQKANFYLRPSIAKLKFKISQPMRTSPSGGYSSDSDRFGEDMNDSQAEDRNVLIFKNPFSDDSLVDMEVNNKDPSDKKVKPHFNPFSSDESEEEASKHPYTCDQCGKSFSRNDFVAYHNIIFHTKKDFQPKGSKPAIKYVDEPEEMMISFSKPSISTYPKKDKINKQMKKTSLEKVKKFNLRNKSSKKLLFE